MTRLSLRSPAAGLVPLEIGDTGLVETDPGPVTLLAAFDIPALETRLAPLGLAWPEPGTLVEASAKPKGAARPARAGTAAGSAAKPAAPQAERAGMAVHAAPGLAPGPVSIVWHGANEALLLGTAAPDPGKAGVATDLSDQHAHLRLAGPLAEAALARLVPLDLSPTAFPARRAGRSLLGKVPVLIRRAGRDGFDLAVPRSMVGTAVTELRAALTLAQARKR